MNILIYIAIVPGITFTISFGTDLYRKRVSCFSLKTAIFSLAFPVSQITREEVASKKDTVAGSLRARPHAHC